MFMGPACTYGVEDKRMLPLACPVQRLGVGGLTVLLCACRQLLHGPIKAGLHPRKEGAYLHILMHQVLSKQTWAL